MGGESVVSERPAAGIYASLFEKINLDPVSELIALDIWQDAQAIPLFVEGNKPPAALASTGPASHLPHSRRDSVMCKLSKETVCNLSIKSGADNVMCENFFKI